jgi:hypothetical protein
LQQIEELANFNQLIEEVEIDLDEKASQFHTQIGTMEQAIVQVR